MERLPKVVPSLNFLLYALDVWKCIVCGLQLVFLVQEKRDELLKELSIKQEEKKTLQTELEKYKECDPEVMEQMKKEAIIAREAANRWTGKHDWSFGI